jgi:pentatricopeptide repeat protein
MHWVVPYRNLYDARYYGSQFELPDKVACDGQTNEHIEKLLKDGKDSFQEAWDQLSASRKRYQWVPMALWLLCNSPKHVPDFLLATHSRPYPPFGAITDCMLYLRWFHREIIPAKNFQSALSVCMDPERWPTVALSQRGVRLFVMFAGLEDVTRAFMLMRRRDSHMSAATALAFMNRFTKGQDISRAIEALRIIPALHKSDLSLDSESVERHCCKLLTLDTVEDKDGARNFKILPQLLELGVRPTRDMMNVVLANAFQTGDPNLGLDMFEYMKAQGMKVDSYTYLTLLNDAVVRGDRGRVDKLLQEIYLSEELKKNRYVASKIFHAHFIFATKNANSQADSSDMFLSMLDLYSRFYDLTPLKDLQLIRPSYVKISPSDDSEPSSHVLFIVLATYLRTVKSTDRIMRVYRRFRELVSQGHKHIAPLIQYPHIFNEFILVLRSDSYATRLCVQIVEDMLRPVTQPLIVEGREIVPAKPNVWTWNTLLSVFAWHRQPNAVRLINDMMDKHGVGYNSVTWNTMISGHVHKQDVAETAAAIRDMESQGFSMDSYTLRALRFLRDPEQLRLTITELDKQTQELADMEMAAEQKEHEELLERGLRRLARSVKKYTVPR